MKTITTSYGKDGKLAGVPKDFTGEVIAWGMDCVPDHFVMESGKIVRVIFMARGDWTRI